MARHGDRLCWVYPCFGHAKRVWRADFGHELSILARTCHDGRGSMHLLRMDFTQGASQRFHFSFDGQWLWNAYRRADRGFPLVSRRTMEPYPRLVFRTPPLRPGHFDHDADLQHHLLQSLWDDAQKVYSNLRLVHGFTKPYFRFAEWMAFYWHSTVADHLFIDSDRLLRSLDCL